MLSTPGVLGLASHSYGRTSGRPPRNRCGQVPAGTAVDVPAAGADNFRLTIQEPWGADVVQVVACTRKTSLHQMVSQMARAIPQGQTVRGMDRGMVVESLSSALAGAPVGVPEESSGPPRWATAHVVVCTYPKMVDSSGHALRRKLASRFVMPQWDEGASP